MKAKLVGNRAWMQASQASQKDHIKHKDGSQCHCNADPQKLRCSLEKMKVKLVGNRAWMGPKPCLDGPKMRLKGRKGPKPSYWKGRSRATRCPAKLAPRLPLSDHSGEVPVHQRWTMPMKTLFTGVGWGPHAMDTIATIETYGQATWKLMRLPPYYEITFLRLWDRRALIEHWYGAGFVLRVVV